MHCKNRLEIIKFFNEMKTQDIIDLIYIRIPSKLLVPLRCFWLAFDGPVV